MLDPNSNPNESSKAEARKARWPKSYRRAAIAIVWAVSTTLFISDGFTNLKWKLRLMLVQMACLVAAVMLTFFWKSK